MSIYATRAELRLPVYLAADTAHRYGLLDPAEGIATEYPLPRPPDHPGRRVRQAWVRVWVQAVPAHIDCTGPGWDGWLPPPVPEDAPHPRAVFFVTDWTRKGTPRNGQEYAAPLLVLTGAEYATRPWPALQQEVERRLAEALAGW